MQTLIHKCSQQHYLYKSKTKPKCPLNDQWINEIWHSHTMAYYTAIKRKEMEEFPHWRNAENTVLMKNYVKEENITPSPKGPHSMIPPT